MVKIDMGAHIDGFIAVVAHTVVISDGKSKVTGHKADAILATHSKTLPKHRGLRQF